MKKEDSKKSLIDSVFSKYWGRFFTSRTTGRQLILSTSYCLYDLNSGESCEIFNPDSVIALPKLHFYQNVFNAEYGKKFSQSDFDVGKYYKDIEDRIPMPYLSVRKSDGKFSIVSLVDGLYYINVSKMNILDAFDGDEGDFIPISKEEAIRLALTHYKTEYYGKIYF